MKKTTKDELEAIKLKFEGMSGCPYCNPCCPYCGKPYDFGRPYRWPTYPYYPTPYYPTWKPTYWQGVTTTSG